MSNKIFLTQEEVDMLPEGTIVNIMWSGGNAGEYELMKFHEHTYTKDLMGNLGNLVKDVGTGIAHTKVWVKAKNKKD